MKRDRHTAILRLIETEDIETQGQLAQRLAEMNVPVTQATISRDIKNLRLVKVPAGDGRSKYAASGQPAEDNRLEISERLARIFVNSVLSVAYSGNMIVLSTLSGSANAAAEAIDSMALPEILGTMAGDNTIFIVAKQDADAPLLARRFEDMLNK